MVTYIPPRWATSSRRWPTRAAASCSTDSTSATGELLSGFDFPEPLYDVKLVTEKGPGIDRLRVTNTDRSGREFFTQTVDFDALFRRRTRSRRARQNRRASSPSLQPS
jgi:hypothetical protein